MSMKVLLLFFMVLLVGCNSTLKKPDAPVDLLSQSKMIEVTKDLMLLEAGIENRYGQVAKYHKVMSASGKQLLKTHGITEKQYFTSLEYYSIHQEEMTRIYSVVLDSLNIQLNK
mgnify:CR=1 FL=1